MCYNTCIYKHICTILIYFRVVIYIELGIIFGECKDLIQFKAKEYFGTVWNFHKFVLLGYSFVINILNCVKIKTVESFLKISIKVPEI